VRQPVPESFFHNNPPILKEENGLGVTKKSASATPSDESSLPWQDLQNKQNREGTYDNF